MEYTSAEGHATVKYWRRAFEIHESYLWAWADFAECVKNFERLQYDTCYRGCACNLMIINDWVNLLPHHRDANFPPIRYARPPFSQNSLLQLSLRIVRPQLVAFVRRCYWPFWHFREFEDAQQYLLDNLKMPKGISYWALPPLDYFEKHHPGCNLCIWVRHQRPPWCTNMLYIEYLSTADHQVCIRMNLHTNIVNVHAVLYSNKRANNT